MKIKSFLSVISIYTLFSCTSNTQPVERSDIDFVIVSDSIESIMPGQLFVFSNNIVWTDPFTIEGYIHILDKITGKEIAKAVNKGQGPEDFATPSAGYALNNQLLIFDLNSDKAAYYSFNDADSPNTKFFKLNLQGETRLIELAKGKLLSFNPALQNPFKWNGRYWGKLPLDQLINNNESVSQGNILYNPYSNLIVYSSMSFPYLSIYQFKNNEIKLVSEKKGDFDYTIVNEEMIINKKRKGAMESALTSDYIVTLERDYKVDDTDESTVGRDFNKLPHTVFLYDYSLNLKKILNVGIPILRIAADPKENTLYAIGVKPDFTLIKCELE